jgi:lipopolysaccharide export LptBFGC system permease protein LptF
MEDLLIWEQNENSIDWRYSLTAKKASLVKHNVAPERDRWRFEQAIEHRYDEEGRPIEMIAHEKPIERELEAGLDQYLANRKEPDQMNLVELSRYIETLRRRKEDVSKYVTDWYLKLVFPFSTVALGMIAFALALRAHTASLPLAFGFGVFLTMIFYAMAALGQALAHVAVVPPLVGALGPISVFLFIGLYLLRRSGFAS